MSAQGKKWVLLMYGEGAPQHQTGTWDSTCRESVYGDLLQSNVMVVENGNGRLTGGILVDFDACGEHGKDGYPLAVGGWINRREGMEFEKLICKKT